MTETASATAQKVVLDIVEATVRFDRNLAVPPALNAVSLSVTEGTTVGIVGESGSGKSTLAKAIVGTNKLTSGSILLDGTRLDLSRRKELWNARRQIQLIPQNPYSSLNPRRTIGAAIEEALEPRGRNAGKHTDRIAHWLEVVQLPADAIHRYPHEFSGGQRQRIAIARALAIEPRVLIADEITSALDASVQKEVLSLIAQLREELGFTMLFISHNLAVVQQVSDEVVVLFRGDVVEHGETQQIFTAPQHDYTKTLLAAIPGLPGFSLD